jgi:hypothetical protein
MGPRCTCSDILSATRPIFGRVGFPAHHLGRVDDALRPHVGSTSPFGGNAGSDGRRKGAMHVRPTKSACLTALSSRPASASQS